MSADLFLPVSADPVPALLMVLPYRKDIWGIVAFEASLRWFAERGFACLLVDLTGTGSSDGVFRGRLHAGEGDDVLASIDWAATQPWCTGNVGMWGLSYGASTAMRGASRNPQPLKAIIPISGAFDPRRNGNARGDLALLVRWGGHMLLEQLLPPLLNFTSEQEQRRWHRRQYDAEPVLMDMARGPRDPAWRERTIDAESIRVPTLAVSGWRDLHRENMVRVYEQVQGPKKLLVGPWGHTLPHDSPVEPVDFHTIALRWWDHWLRGVDNGVMDEPPVTLYIQGGSPHWRAFEVWPPAKSELAFSLGSSATLVHPKPDNLPRQTTGTVAEYEPDPTIGSLSGLRGFATSGLGPALDQHDDDMRALSATSAPLPADLLICGRPIASLRLAREGSSVRGVERIVVRLAEVDAQGRSALITEAVLSPDGATETHRIVLETTARRVRAGQRLRVVLSDSDFPRLTPLASPSPIRVAALEVSIPTMPEDTGLAVDMPTGDRAMPEAASTGERWAITRDPIQDGVEVTMGNGSLGIVTSQGHRLDLHEDCRATVRRAAPEAALSTGTHTATARLNTGEEIMVTATVRCSQTTMWAQGTITIDGTTTFSRSWDAPLTHAMRQ